MKNSTDAGKWVRPLLISPDTKSTFYPRIQYQHPTSTGLTPCSATWVDRNWGTPGTKKTKVKSERTVDLVKISREHFYDPAMKGGHSIKVVLPVVWKNPAIQKLFPKYALDQHGQPVRNPYDSLPALTLQDSANGSPIDLSKLEDLDVVKNGTGAMRAYEHLRYGLAAGDQAERRSVRRQLMRYCELDTAAMVMVWRH